MLSANNAPTEGRFTSPAKAAVGCAAEQTELPVTGPGCLGALCIAHERIWPNSSPGALGGEAAGRGEERAAAGATSAVTRAVGNQLILHRAQRLDLKREGNKNIQGTQRGAKGEEGRRLSPGSPGGHRATLPNPARLCGEKKGGEMGCGERQERGEATRQPRPPARTCCQVSGRPPPCRRVPRWSGGSESTRRDLGRQKRVQALIKRV